MFKVSLLNFTIGLAATSIAVAQPLKSAKSVQDLPGYQCMALASSYAPDGINAPPAPVYAGPETSAARVGGGAGILVVPDPIQPTNGRTVMIWPNGRKVWIDVSLITKWHSVNNPNAVCIPTLLSNGRYGTRIPH